MAEAFRKRSLRGQMTFIILLCWLLPMALAAKRAGIRRLFVPADNAPEATLAVCQRMAPGIPEAMRYACPSLVAINPMKR